MARRQLYLAAYDIASARRRRRVLRQLRDYADGGQKSAYECWLSPGDIPVLLSDAEARIDISEDRFALIPLDPRRGVFTMGRALQPGDPDFFYFG